MRRGDQAEDEALGLIALLFMGIFWGKASVRASAAQNFHFFL